MPRSSRTRKRRDAIPEAPPAFPSIGHIRPQDELAEPDADDASLDHSPPERRANPVALLAMSMVGLAVVVLAAIGAATVAWVLLGS